MPDPSIRISVLGPLQLVKGDTDVTPSAMRERNIVASLALAPSGFLTTSQLLDALYPGDRPDRARNSVQVAISRLRRLVGGEIAVAERGGYHLAPCVLDHVLFLRLQQQLDTSQDPTADCRTALALWRGALALPDQRELPDLSIEARILDRRRVELVEVLAARLLEEDPRAALDVLERDALRDRHREPLQELYLRALHQAGDHTQARAWRLELQQLD